MNAESDSSLKQEIARLAGRVSTLERALERRSRELRLILRQLCARDLVLTARVLAGLSPFPRLAHQPLLWQETAELTPADAEEALDDLWASLRPLADQLPKDF